MAEVLPVKQPVINRICLKILPVSLVGALVFSLLGHGVVSADTTWTQTTQADFTAGTLVQLDAASSPGDVKLAKVGSSYLYAFKGNNIKTFCRYNIVSHKWLGFVVVLCCV